MGVSGWIQDQETFSQGRNQMRANNVASRNLQTFQITMMHPRTREKLTRLVKGVNPDDAARLARQDFPNYSVLLSAEAA